MRMAYWLASLVSDSSGCFYTNIISWTYWKYGFKNVYLLRMLRDITKTTLKINQWALGHETAWARPEIGQTDFERLKGQLITDK